MSENTVVTKKEPGMAQLVIILFAISAITALLLGLVNMITAPVIAANNEAKNAAAMAAVLPADNYCEVAYTGDDTSIIAMYQAGDAGYVVEVTPSGFGGEVDLMVGVGSDGTVTGISVITHSETSGLGAKAKTDPEWGKQFIGMSGEVKVSKDGGKVNAPLITADTMQR